MDDIAGKLSKAFSSVLRNKKKPMPYIKLEWGADFPQPENHLLDTNDTPVLTTTSAHLTRELLETTGGCAFLPSQWEKEYPQLFAETDIQPIIRPLYAVWMKNSEQQLLVRQLLKVPLINDATHLLE